MATTLKSLEGGHFQSLARMFSSKWDVHVRLAGVHPRTDGRVIEIPVNSGDLSEASQACIEGLLDHEVCHVREQQEAAARQKAGVDCITPQQQMDACKDRTERMMLNFFEDVRIENAAREQWPGVADNLAAAADHYVGVQKARVEGVAETGRRMDPWSLVGSIIAWGARGTSLAWVPPEAQEFIELLRPEMDAANKAKSVEDCYRLAVETIEKVRDLVESKKEPEPEPEDEDDSAMPDPDGDTQDEDGEPGESEGEPEFPDFGEDDDEEDDQDGGDPEKDDQDGAGADPEDDDQESAWPEDDEPQDDELMGSGLGGEEEDEDEDDDPELDGAPAGGSEDEDEDKPEDEDKHRDGADAGEDEGEDDDQELDANRDGEPGPGKQEDPTEEEPKEEDPEAEARQELFDGLEDEATEEDPMDAIREEIAKEAERDAEENHGQRWIPHPEMLRLDKWETPRKRPNADETYRTVLNRVRSQVSTMRSRLRIKLQTRAEDRVEADRESGAIDVASLYSLTQGNKRIFSERMPGIATDTAVSMLIDQSGSMSFDSKYKRAAESAIALAETLDSLDVPFEVIGFDNRDRERIPYESPYTRHLPFRYSVYKAFHERHRAVKARLCSIHAGRENVDGEAVLAVARRLAQRPEARKIMIVLSDGMPAGGEAENYRVVDWHLGEAVRTVSGAGIEIYGIGINSTDVLQYYNRANGSENVVVRNVSELATQVIKLLSGKLMVRRAA